MEQYYHIHISAGYPFGDRDLVERVDALEPISSLHFRIFLVPDELIRLNSLVLSKTFSFNIKAEHTLHCEDQA